LGACAMQKLGKLGQKGVNQIIGQETAPHRTVAAPHKPAGKRRQKKVVSKKRWVREREAIQTPTKGERELAGPKNTGGTHRFAEWGGSKMLEMGGRSRSEEVSP